MKIEKFEMKNQERNQERNFSRGGSSSDKRTRESQVDSVQGSVTRGRRQGPPMTQGSDIDMSTGQDERLECPHCRKYYLDIYKWVTGGFFRCGNADDSKFFAGIGDF